jgi:hypothetical protein
MYSFCASVVEFACFRFLRVLGSSPSFKTVRSGRSKRDALVCVFVQSNLYSRKAIREAEERINESAEPVSGRRKASGAGGGINRKRRCSCVLVTLLVTTYSTYVLQRFSDQRRTRKFHLRNRLLFIHRNTTLHRISKTRG